MFLVVDRWLFSNRIHLLAESINEYMPADEPCHIVSKIADIIK